MSSNLHIGLSGLRVAQQAIEIIGTNLSNAQTEGYHVQRVKVKPVDLNRIGGMAIGGAEVSEVRRDMNVLLENEIFRQYPTFGQLDQELMTLRTIENSLGDIDADGLQTALDGFYGALRELSADPTSRPLQEQAAWAADNIARYFRTLGEFFGDLESHVRLEATDLVGTVNQLTETIADLNDQIHGIGVRGGNTNLLLDQRDQAIAQLAEIIPIRIEACPDGHGLVNITGWGTPLVVRNSATALEVGNVDGDNLGVSIRDAAFFQSNLTGGRLGGLINLKNNTVNQILDKLNTLAREVMRTVNEQHVQGLGPAGSFAELTGVKVEDPTDALNTTDWAANVSDNDLHIRLVSSDTPPVVTRLTYAVDTTKTLAQIAGEIDALDPTKLRASIVEDRLHIEGVGGYKFDFLPALKLDATGLADPGAPAVAVDGVYTGGSNQTYTLTVSGSGDIGITGGLELVVTNQAGQSVRRLNIGAGYAAGDRLEIDAGVHITLGVGTVADAETITVEALNRSDESGLLAAAGLNTLFQGEDAARMTVAPEIMANPSRIATATTADLTDNQNLLRLAELGETRLASLGGATPSDFYRMMVTDVGQRVSIAQARQESIAGIMQQLQDQKDRISGVDINDQAAQMVVYEQMFQAVSKLINTQVKAMQILMDLL